MTNPKGPLYRRLKSGEDYWTYLHRQEETFNHIFNLTFAVLPGDVVGEIFNVFTSAGSGHSYESLGRELGTRYFWGEYDNITTPDGFFVADNSILAVELKFNAKTSLDQLAKYMLLFVVEEMVSGQRGNLDLFYVFNSDPAPTFEEQIGVKPTAVGEHLFDDLFISVSNETVKRFLQDNASAFRNTLGRINLSCIMWQDLLDTLVAFSERLEEGRGDRTLKRLISGLITEIAQHPLSNVTSAD